MHSGIPPHESGEYKFTVPAIKHVASNTYMMDSGPIAEFLENTFPQPAILPASSGPAQEIAARARSALGSAMQASLLPREIRILRPRSQVYFRRTREQSIGRPLDNLLAEEQQHWDAVQGEMQALNDLILATKGDKPFLLGSQPNGTDVFLGGALQSARVIDEQVFGRVAQYPGFKAVYDAMVPFMDKRD